MARAAPAQRAAWVGNHFPHRGTVSAACIPRRNARMLEERFISLNQYKESHV